MVEVRRAGDDEVPLGLQIQQQVKQSDGIRSARERDEHTGIGTRQRVLPNRLTYSVRERHDSW